MPSIDGLRAAGLLISTTRESDAHHRRYLEERSLFGESSLKRARVQTKLFCNALDRATTVGELSVDQVLSLTADVQRKSAHQIAQHSFGVEAKIAVRWVNGTRRSSEGKVSE